MSTIRAATQWPSNAYLIADCARLGYISRDSYTLDPTFGRGAWWLEFCPERLVAHDLRIDGVDFRRLPHSDGEFDVVAFDPPYKLNGTPTPEVDDRYGVAEPTSWRDRVALMAAGLQECIRVLGPGGYLLVKCQDQVCSGKVRWQSHLMVDVAMGRGMELVDSLLMLGYRAQPAGRRQVHAHRNYSTLLIFRKQR